VKQYFYIDTVLIGHHRVDRNALARFNAGPSRRWRCKHNGPRIGRAVRSNARVNQLRLQLVATVKCLLQHSVYELALVVREQSWHTKVKVFG
jgi:hypothetical protein